jgi:hypothetical protein
MHDLKMIRITTHAAVVRVPLTVGAALACVDDWLSPPYVNVVVPGQRHRPILKAVLAASGSAAHPIFPVHPGNAGVDSWMK